MTAPRRARVFVVEDEAIIALEIEDHLTQLGHEVVGVALSAEGTLERIVGASPDVVLMDVNLGPGPDGIALAEQLRSVSPRPAIVFLTAYSEEIVARASAAGAVDCVLKPFRPDALRTSLENVLASLPAS